jgi:hypothetical protein
VNRADISSLDDDELLERVEALARRSRGADADMVEHLAELDRRGLCPKREYGSLFEYCVNRLNMSEGAAYRRIRAARAFRAFPPFLNMLRDGRLSLEALALLHPYARDPDIAQLALRAAGMRTRRLEIMLAERRPRAPRRDDIRFAAAPAASRSPVAPLFGDPAPVEAPVPSAAVSPVAVPARAVRVAFTADEEFYRMLERARALLRHKYPDGRLEGVLGDALKALIARRDPIFRWRAGGAPRAHPPVQEP